MMATEEVEKADKRTQTAAALGIGFVCIIVGLPLWWKTTEVYRVQLPYGEIEQLATAKVAYKVDFSVVLFDDSLKKPQLATFGEKLKEALQNIASSEPRLSVSYQGRIRHCDPDEKDIFSQSESLQELDSRLAHLSTYSEHGRYSILLLPPGGSLQLNQPVIGRRRMAYMHIKNDLSQLLPSLTHMLRDLYVNEGAMVQAFQSAKGAIHMKADKESMRALRSSPGYEVTFTLLNPQPDILNVQWDIRAAIKNYLDPLLASFSQFVSINVKSQYLHHIGLGVHPKKDEAAGGFVLTPDQLPHIINPVEAYLASHVSTNPNLNFLMYVPTRDQSPLYIQDAAGKSSSSNAFLSPRWGGMLVYNVASPVNVSLPAPVDVDVRLMMQVFVAQLRLLLGVHTVSSEEGIEIQQPGNMAVSHWETDQWLRGRSLENVATAAATLRSLAQLLEEISNIVINDDIGREVERAVDSIKKSMVYLADGQLRNAFVFSRQAILSSEKAFFDPSLLELLYFPEDQKFAIYIPLFLPISIPVLMSIAQASKWLMGKKKDKVKDE